MKIRFSFWPAGIIVLLAGFFCGIMTLVGIASSSRTELVSENYYEQEIRYQQRIDGLSRAHDAGAVLAFDQAQNRLALSFGTAKPEPSTPVVAQLYRPSSASNDCMLPLAPRPDGTQSLDLTSLQPGPWKVHAAWTSGGVEYFLEASVTNRGAPAAIR